MRLGVVAGLRPLKLSLQPRSGKRPIAFDRAFGKAQSEGGAGDIEAGVEAQPHHGGGWGVHGLQLRHCRIEREQCFGMFPAFLGRDGLLTGQGDRDPACPGR